MSHQEPCTRRYGRGSDVVVVPVDQDVVNQPNEVRNDARRWVAGVDVNARYGT